MRKLRVTAMCLPKQFFTFLSCRQRVPMPTESEPQKRDICEAINRPNRHACSKQTALRLAYPGPRIVETETLREG